MRKNVEDFLFRHGILPECIDEEKVLSYILEEM